MFKKILKGLAGFTITIGISILVSLIAKYAGFPIGGRVFVAMIVGMIGGVITMVWVLE